MSAPATKDQAEEAAVEEPAASPPVDEQPQTTTEVTERQQRPITKNPVCIAVTLLTLCGLVLALVLVFSLQPEENEAEAFYKDLRKCLEREMDQRDQEVMDCIEQYGCYNPGCDAGNNCYSNSSLPELCHEEDLYGRCGDMPEQCYETGYCNYVQNCPAPGRPFLDSTCQGPIVAGLVIASSNGKAFSSSWKMRLQGEGDGVSTKAATTEAWAQRALGEHASIASFAAFTIALLTHGAPSYLVEEALVAAQDELRHARLVFGLASGSATVGPGPLPASRLEFSLNLTALALAAAREGCLDETLSTLELAADYDDERTAAVEQRILESLAWDEARHAGLAWRTVDWVCEQDPEACQATLAHVLSSDAMRRSVSQRFGAREDAGQDYLIGVSARLLGFLLQWLQSTRERRATLCADHQVQLEHDFVKGPDFRQNFRLMPRIAAAIRDNVCDEHPAATS